jgi:hypothetical protein
MLIELKDRREVFGHDKRAINRHSIRIYQDPIDKRIYQLDKQLDGIPPFYTAYGPMTENFQGVAPVLKVEGQERWGSAYSWREAEEAFFHAVEGDSERKITDLIRTPKGLGRIVDIDVNKGRYLVAIGGMENHPRWFLKSSCKKP